jgi:outer membrane autotransporter protein
LTLSSSGVVSGTATVVGSFNFTIRATDTNGFAGEQAYTLAVAALVPVAGNDSAHTIATQAVTVDVTANDTGGPFTAATVLSVTPLNAGSATIAKSGAAWLLTFVPAADFSGTASVRYTVSNAYATSAAATLSIMVEARPDPSRDPDVLGLLSAQANATRGFARAQIQNVQQRLESLHGGADGNGWHNNLSLANPMRCDRNTFDRTVAACPQMQDTGAATPAPSQPSAAPVGLWTAGAFGSGDRDARFGRSALDFETSGISVGADYRLSGSFVLGTALGYGRDRTNVGVRETRADGESYSAMAYASWSPSAASFVDAVFGYQRLSFDTRRTVAANGATVTGSRDGAQWFGSLATGYEYRDGGTLVAPYGRVDLGKAQLDAYAERGDATYALRYGRQDVDTGTASVGLRVEHQFRQEWGMFAPLFRVEHQHDFQGQGDTMLQYADLPAGPFYRAFGDTFDRSRWLLGLGTGFTFSDALNLKFEYLYMGDGNNEDESLRVILQGRF